MAWHASKVLRSKWDFIEDCASIWRDSRMHWCKIYLFKRFKHGLRNGYIAISFLDKEVKHCYFGHGHKRRQFNWSLCARLYEKNIGNKNSAMKYKCFLLDKYDQMISYWSSLYIKIDVYFFGRCHTMYFYLSINKKYINSFRMLKFILLFKFCL